MLTTLCGQDAGSRITLVTTKWDNAFPADLVEREKELRDMFWRDFITLGSSMSRFPSTGDNATANDTAVEIIKRITEREKNGDAIIL